MELDYDELGVKAGLECHQQLDTGKLFCRCPSVLRDDKPDIVFKRHLRAVASELGEYDPAALEAFRKGLTYVYEAYSDTNCLIETDEEPPKPVDSKALETILKVALMVNANIPDELIVMRKAVIDGSNTAGFQRTMLVATGGKMKINEKEINIQTLVLEEDAARPMEKKEKEIVYMLDRLGIPLIELATAPELHMPEEVKEAALAIGNLFRLTGKAKRGLGTIRQDINISIAEGARVEVKGVQELEAIDEYVRREVLRQVNLLEIKKVLEKRGVVEKDLEKKFIDVSDCLKETECKFIKGKNVLALKLARFKGILGKEIQPERRFGTELADYVKVKAGLPGILHSDELPGYGISKLEVETIESALSAKEDDAFVLVAANKANAEEAFGVVIKRCKWALHGIPEETRNALEGGNTEYSRPLPGAARMYPETDLETIRIDKKYLETLGKELPKSAAERKEQYMKLGLSEKLAEKMKLSNYAALFEELVKKGYDPKQSAVLLLEGLVQLKRAGVNVDLISNEMIGQALKAFKEGEITQDILLDVLGEWSKQLKASFDTILKTMKLEKVSEKELQELVRKVIEKNKKLVEENGMHSIGALMGEVMKEVRGKASGKDVNDVLKKELEKVLK